MSHMLLSGANGFVGRALGRVLVDAGHTVTGLVRQQGGCVDGVHEWVHSDTDFDKLTGAWPEHLQPDCVVHLAARVHIMNDKAANPDAAFRATNVDGALRMAAAAREHGAKRFVFVSSIKATAEGDHGRPLRETDPPHPEDAYGRSKLAAEQALTRFGQQTGLEIVIARPPLVYGPQVRANFLRLLDAVWRGTPLPLGAIDARRSMVYVGNLADALAHCATDPRAAGQCFHIADATDPTVADVVRTLARHMNKPARLLPVPLGLLRLAGNLTGRTAQIDRLTGSMRVDTTHIREVLGWLAPISSENGLAATAEWYRVTH
ncbi:NAD-dependent epimerase/dehydratase family protein [Paraburkholderia sp. 1N]|uniref:NAD-dependent epimerase/dehydratase family protein n=1 Tax=Paraburkholderia solitsugae TaxID=2675748 RepID=A0ABX2BN56_9BURK|nr:SDR family oxidoreductase [Paraburkholderia solitsugae]NPT42362.1 NAD-dependent epimerase/dehydratase family protein [Paraburkholderia solitsugae]